MCARVHSCIGHARTPKQCLPKWLMWCLDTASACAATACFRKSLEGVPAAQGLAGQNCKRLRVLLHHWLQIHAPRLAHRQVRPQTIVVKVPACGSHHHACNRSRPNHHRNVLSCMHAPKTALVLCVHSPHIQRALRLCTTGALAIVSGWRGAVSHVNLVHHGWPRSLYAIVAPSACAGAAWSCHRHTRHHTTARRICIYLHVSCSRATHCDTHSLTPQCRLLSSSSHPTRQDGQKLCPAALKWEPCSVPIHSPEHGCIF